MDHGFNGSITTSGTATNVGAPLISVTRTVKELVPLSAGTPSSVTRTTTVLVLGPCASVGRNATAPDGLTVRPAGPDTSAKVRRCAGTSASLADKLNARLPVSATRRSDTSAIRGRKFDGRTTTVNAAVIRANPSETETSTRLVVSPWVIDGVHATAPESLTVRPTGPCTSANARR